MASLWKPGGLTWRELGRRVWVELGEDAILGHAAQLAFYFLLSVLPLLLLLTALMGYVLGAGTSLRQALITYLSTVAPAAAAGLIDATLQEVATGVSGGNLSFGLLLLLWAASSGMAVLSNVLNTVYEAEETRPWWKVRFVALVLMSALLGLTLLPLVLIIYGGDMAQAVATRVGLGWLWPILWNLVQWPMVLTCVLLAFNLVYLYAPNITHQAWRWLMPGTVVGVVLWLLASMALKLHLSVFHTYSLLYGSLGTMIILLLWLYMTSIALLIGGEVNAEVKRAAGTAAAARKS